MPAFETGSPKTVNINIINYIGIMLPNLNNTMQPIQQKMRKKRHTYLKRSRKY